MFKSSIPGKTNTEGIVAVGIFEIGWMENVSVPGGTFGLVVDRGSIHCEVTCDMLKL
jgi:hypothetical protein